MPFIDNNRDSCGYLDWLHSTDFRFKVRRFVLLKAETNFTLEVYFTNSQKEENRKLHSVIPLTSISSVMRYKRGRVKNVFYIVVNGDKMFFAGEDEQDIQGWCDLIQARIPLNRSIFLPGKSSASSHGNSTFYLSISNLSIPRNNSDFSSWNEIKTGYCKKMSGKGFRWLDRYLVLNADGLSYFTCDFVLKGFIKNEAILTCRTSNGVYPNIKELFEIVTRTKVYYCQAKSENERKEWIKCINLNNNCNKTFSFKKNRKSSYE